MVTLNDPILVLAAKGKTGRRVADRLEQDGIPVRRASRSSHVPFDWNDSATWPAAMRGVQAAYVAYIPDLVVPGAPTAIQAFTDLAVGSGLKKLVLLSGRGESAAQQCEQIVLNADIDATVVRASWFNQNFSEGAFHEDILRGKVTLPVGSVREPFIDVDDIADVAVAALTRAGHTDKVYEVTGPRLMTLAEVVATIGKATGRDIAFESVTIDQFTEGLRATGMPSG